MSDLASFLRARISEDESVARETRERRYFEHAIEDGCMAEGYPSPVRLLAECEAKGQAVTIFQNHPGADPRDDRRWNEYAGMNAMLCALALPYADHPDFDPEWRTAP